MERVLIACDKFKGSLSAREVGAALERGIKACQPQLLVKSIPIADGGEGTLEAAVSAGYIRVPVAVSGPTGDRITAFFAWEPSTQTAVVEMAQASGLARLPGALQPLTSSTYGTGELVRSALDRGARRVILAVGGSASTDGGAGFLSTLGAPITDEDGRKLAPGGGALNNAAAVDLTGLDARLGGCEFVLATDVDNPLLGPRGAAAVYGPQKGASPSDVLWLEAGLTRFSIAARQATGNTRSAHDLPGAGAAGGLGFAALAVLSAQTRPGVEVVMDFTGFTAALAELSVDDLVITGEGCLDAQTLSGKAPAGVALAASRRGIGVVAVCGRNLLDKESFNAIGIHRTYALTDVESDLRRCIDEAGPLLEQVGQRIATETALTPHPIQ